MSVVLRLAKATRRFRRYRFSWLDAAILFNAVVLLAAPLAAGLYYLAQRDSVALQWTRDVALLQANLDQTLSLDRERLQDGSHEVATAGLLLARFELMQKENPALLALDYLDASGQRRTGWPDYPIRPAHLPPCNDPLIVAAIERARQRGGPVYSQIIEQYAPLWVLVVPLDQSKQPKQPEQPEPPGQPGGVLLATYDLERLMQQIVPRPLGQRHDLQWQETRPSPLTHRIAFDPPSGNISGNTLAAGGPDSGLLLRVTPLAGAHPGPLFWSLTLILIALAGLIIFLLRLLQRWLRERLRVQFALAKELRFREAMEQSLATGLLAFDRQARIIYANSAICQLLGLPHAQLIGSRAPYAFWPEPGTPEQQQVWQVHQAMLHGENPAQGHQVSYRTAGGKRLAVRLFASPLVDGDNRLRGWMASLVDMTAEQRAANLASERDELLQHASRLASLAEFASGIAHELNQPLAALANYAAAATSLLAREPLPFEKIRQAVTRIGDESHRAGQIVRSLRDFIQKREVRMEPHDLATLVNEPLLLLAPLLQRLEARVQVQADTGRMLIQCDAVMIEQVLFNLLRNAIEAQGAAGRLAEPILLQLQRETGPNGDQVHVSVLDHGPGIAEPERLFQPFYSTKSEGMGLGLAICRTVIESHGGHLFAENRATGGARFSFWLPCLV